MALGHSPQIVTNGLVFYYDMANVEKSWKGKPTTNHAAWQNPRLDTTYASYSATGGGTWNTKHPDAIRVYNDSGTEITGYVNTGVTDWTNTYHAIWTYDRILERPVVTMRDFDGQWKAKSFSIPSYTDMGLSAGSTYTISWLQWVDNISKCANSGVYAPTSGGSYNFHDGLSSTQRTSFNTKVGVWQRVYATFTVSSGLNYTTGLSIYMYGHDTGGRSTVKVADVQMEVGTRSGFSKASTRTSTQAIIDLMGRTTLTPNNLTYNADGTFSYNGTNSWISTFGAVSALPAGSSDSTMLVWCMPDPTATADSYAGLIAYGARSSSDSRLLSLNTSGGSTITISSAYWGNDYVPNNVTVQPNNWNLVAMTTRGSATTNNTTLYRVNNSSGISSTTGNSSLASALATQAVNLSIGSTDMGGRYMKGRIASAMIYNRSLSQNEILSIYNATKERFYGFQTLTYINSSNVTVTGNILEQQVNMFKNADNGTWNGQAYSLEPFTAPCTIEFNKEAAATDNSLSYAMIGWNDDPAANASFNTIDYAAYPFMRNGYEVYHNGTQVLANGAGVTWDSSKKLYVVYDTDGFIRHYNGDKLLYSVNYGTGKTVYVDSSLYSVDATFGGFKNVKVSRKSWNGTRYV